MSLIKDLFTSDSGASYIAMPIPKNRQKCGRELQRLCAEGR
jgi:hypothetical protein